jgi:hypothetical protein
MPLYEARVTVDGGFYEKNFANRVFIFLWELGKKPKNQQQLETCYLTRTPRGIIEHKRHLLVQHRVRWIDSSRSPQTAQ